MLTTKNTNTTQITLECKTTNRDTLVIYVDDDGDFVFIAEHNGSVKTKVSVIIPREELEQLAELLPSMEYSSH